MLKYDQRKNLPQFRKLREIQAVIMIFIKAIVLWEITKMENPEPTPEALQRKLYFLLEQLQDMARELPP